MVGITASFVYLYLNGELADVCQDAGYAPENDDNVLLGRADWGAFHYGGLDNIRIWGRALSQIEINGNLTNYNNLEAEYTFDVDIDTVDSLPHP